MKHLIEWIEGKIPHDFEDDQVMVWCILHESNSYLPIVQGGSSLFYKKNPNFYSHWAKIPDELLARPAFKR